MNSLSYVFTVCAAVIALTSSCSAHSHSPAVEHAPEDVQCKLKSMDPIDNIMSICILDSQSFTITTDNRIMMFNMDGTYIRDIGRNGRAKGEHIRPKQVRFAEYHIEKP